MAPKVQPKQAAKAKPKAAPSRAAAPSPLKAAGAMALGSPTAAKASAPKASGAAAPKAPGAARAGAVSPAGSSSAATSSAKKAEAEQEAKAAAQAEAKAKAAEEEAKAKDAAELAKKQAASKAAEEELKRLAALANGEVTVKYNMYTEKFPIKDHKLTAETIDETYCLSDVMPGCFIHLGNKEFVYGEEHSYIKEDPPGTFLGLMAGETYWCYVQQDPEQEKRDQEAMRQHWTHPVGGGLGDRGKEGESCSCGDGAPCTDPMICKDWDNRFANAIKAGGNPLLFTGT